MSLEETVRKARRGNNKAFQELIQQEKNKLYRMAYLYTRNENDALDIVHDTIYKAYTSIKNLKEAHHFSTWLTRILINNAMSFKKKHNRIVPMDRIERIQTVDNHLLEDSIDIVDAISGLDDQYKTVVILRYYKDFTIKQIAETLNCPEGTVKTQLHRAINKLKTGLKGECINE